MKAICWSHEDILGAKFQGVLSYLVGSRVDNAVSIPVSATIRGLKVAAMLTLAEREGREGVIETWQVVGGRVTCASLH